MTARLLQVDDLHVRFPISGGGLFGTERRMLHAVNGISFELVKGECLSRIGLRQVHDRSLYPWPTGAD